MFVDFTKWLEGYLREHGASAAFKAGLGLLTFASLLGSFFGSQPLRVGAFVVVIFGLLSIAVLALANWHDLKQQRDTLLKQAKEYYEILSKVSPEPLIAVNRWLQRVEIKPSGDVREVLTLEAVTPREYALFARFSASSLWDQPERQLHKVEVTVRRVKADDSLGPTWNVKSFWEKFPGHSNKLVSYPHFDPPLRRGEVIRFQLERTWPAKCRPLMRDKQAEGFWLFMKAMEVRHVEYTVVIPENFSAVYELVGEGAPDVQLSATENKGADGRKEYTWRADKVPMDVKVGIRLQLE